VVRLSARTKASAALRRAIEAVPEIQPGRVAALRAAIEAGRYDIDPDKIAAQMVAAVL
jgi:flagellar biosynthesis anti-sigma factor FlgM